MDRATNIEYLSFASLLGQEKAKNLVGRILSSGRMAHAYLFRGPDGVGKQLFARTMAVILNCSHTTGNTACGKCSSCKKYRSGNHPDFLYIRPEKGSIKIDMIRALKKTLSYPPYESKMRVVFLEDIHTMRPEAANSLLKVLEEPPENNLLILTAESSKAILPTIVSRCQVIPFHSLGIEDTQKLIINKAPDMTEEECLLLARLSEGSPGRALLLQQTDMLNTWENVITLLSSGDGDEIVGQVLQTAERMAELKDYLPSFFGLLRIWLRDKLVGHSYTSTKEMKNRLQPHEEGNAMNKWRSKELFAKMGALDRAEMELAHNCNRTLVCEILLFRLQ